MPPAATYLMQVAVLKETFPGERRVPLVPADVVKLAKAGIQTLVESGAGLSAGFPDQLYRDKGATIAESRSAAFAAPIVLQVRALGANKQAGRADLSLLRTGQIVIGMCDPLGEPQSAADIAQTG